MNKENRCSGVLSAEGQLTLTGTLRTLVSTISGQKILLNLKTDSGAQFHRPLQGDAADLCEKKSIVQTISAVAVSVLTSASVLTVVGFLLGIFSTHGLLSQLVYFLGKGTLCSLAIVLFVLPGLLYLFDRLIVKNKKSKEVISQ